MKTFTETQKVKRLVEVEEKKVVLHLTEAEALDLRAVHGNICCPTELDSSIYDQIGDVLGCKPGDAPSPFLKMPSRKG